MKPEIFKIFRSSAGSGKTYRLAVEYLKLALKYPDYYRRILAVTFTNKATNEMKARIIRFLFDLANAEAEHKLMEELCNELNLNSIQLKDRANNTLRTLLHGYSYFSVSTIDSFFQRVISAFSRDLGIQGGYNLEFELDQVKDEIIDKLFTDLDEKKVLRNWLVQFAMSKIKSNKAWDIRYDIRQLAGQIFFENFSIYYDALNKEITDTTQLSNVLKQIINEKDKIRRKIEKLGQEGQDLLHDYDLDLSDFSRGINGPAGLFYKMSANQKINTSSKYLNNALHLKEAWFTKTSKKQNKIIAALQDGLQDFYEKAIAFYNDQVIKENTYSEAQKYFYNLGILSNLIDGLKEYRDENEVVLISDLSHLLRIIIGENDAPFIYEKVGSFYNHFLIDEFQDTSRFQWSNFLPLILNSMSSGQFNMIVGDVKQSIYRWRGGDWEILQNQVEKDVGKHNINNETLANNWRSLKNIVDFNNTLFKSLSGLLKLKFVGEASNLVEPTIQLDIDLLGKRFEEAYRDVKQDLPDNSGKKQNGIVEIKFISNTVDEQEKVSWKDKVLPELVKRIQSLQDNQYSLKDIAILVRTKNEGKKVANYLLDHKNNQEHDSTYRYDVISSESLFLKSSPAINVIIYFIRLVINQKDTIATANFYYWMSLLKSGDTVINYGIIFQKIANPELQNDLNLKLLNISGHIDFARYRSIPVVDLIEEITLFLRLYDHKEEYAYLLGLQNVVLEYLTNHNNDLNAFIGWWFEEGENKSIKPSLEQNAINILTIHQAKGLEYKTVLIPFCSWDIDHSSQNDNIIWAKSNLPVLDQIPYYPLRYSKQLGESYFLKDYSNEKSLAFMDNLNLLYVALTRAEEGLFVFSELPGKADRRQTVGDMLLQFFEMLNSDHEEWRTAENSNLIQSWNEDDHIFNIGQMAEQAEVERTDSMYNLENYSKGSWQDKISIRKQADILSHEEFEQPGEKINYGILLHDILSKIYRKEQAGSVLDAEVHTGNITIEDKHRLSLMLDSIWNIEKVNNWFTGDWEIKTEVPVLPEKGQLSRMDRVMIKDTKAVVVDYKTGARRPADIYQVKNYMNILEKMGYTRVEGYVLYLINKELIEV